MRLYGTYDLLHTSHVDVECQNRTPRCCICGAAVRCVSRIQTAAS
jgi:hypothetical protein